MREARTPPEPERGSDPPLTVRFSRAGVAIEGLRFGTLALMLGYGVLIWQGGGRTVASLNDLAHEMGESAKALRQAGADASEARAGVGRVEEAQQKLDRRLGAIEGDVQAMRADLRAACAGKR